MVYKWLISSLSQLSSDQCQLCGEPNLHADELCDACWRDMPRFKSSCVRCGNELATATQSPCGQCLEKPPAFDRVLASFAYDIPIRQLISRFKFIGQINLAPLLANSLLRTVLEDQANVEAILPVPLHNSRLRARGFNQAVELARPLASALSLPILLTEVQRARQTEVQSSLSASQREQNLSGAFSMSRPLMQKRIAIVDDVMTTGSTAHELAKLLKANGAEYVEVWCIARASNQH